MVVYLQELMVLAHEVIMTRAVDNLFRESSSTNRPKYEFKRSTYDLNLSSSYYQRLE